VGYYLNYQVVSMVAHMFGADQSKVDPLSAPSPHPPPTRPSIPPSLLLFVFYPSVIFLSAVY
jgi:hypothetical protein